MEPHAREGAKVAGGKRRSLSDQDGEGVPSKMFKRKAKWEVSCQASSTTKKATSAVPEADVLSSKAARTKGAVIGMQQSGNGPTHKQ